MAPYNFEVLGHGVVAQSLVACLGHLVVHLKQARELVAFHVVGLRTQGPRAFREDVSTQLQVHLVADGEVITSVHQTEAAAGVIHIGRHQEAGLVTAGEGKEEERYGQRQRHVLHYQIGRTGYHIFLGAYLGVGHLHIEVRMFVVVARGITALLHIELVACSLLGIVAGDVAFALLAHHIADESLLALEVIADGIGLVGRLSVFEHGQALHYAQGVFHAMGINRTAVHVHGDDLGGQFYVLVRIVHLAFAIEVSIAVLREDDGVIGFVGDRRIQAVFLLGYGIQLQRVIRQRIRLQRIADLQSGVGAIAPQAPLSSTPL